MQMTLENLSKLTPSELREQFGIRFHHFHDRNGRLVATIATAALGAEATDKPFMVDVACAIVSKHEPNVSRKSGRQIALGRLLTCKCVTLPLADLKQMIRDRTVLHLFPGGKKIKLRPRAPFLGADDLSPKPVFDEFTMSWKGDEQG